MKNIAYIILINFLLALLQTSFLLVFFGPTLNPGLVLAFAFSLLEKIDLDKALASALAGGLFMDLFGTTTVGFSVMIILLVLILSTLVKKFIFRGKFVLGVSLIFSHMLYLYVVNFPRIGFFKEVFTGALFTLVFYLLFNTLVARMINQGKKSEYRLS